jgi:hypothetical protein
MVAAMKEGLDLHRTAQRAELQSILQHFAAFKNAFRHQTQNLFQANCQML